MLDHNDFPDEITDAALKKLMTTKLVEFCARDMRPFEIVTGKGFRNLVQYVWSLGSFYGNKDVSLILPHPTTISRNVESIKEKKRQEIMPEIENAIEKGECAATADMWTDDYKKKHFLTMTTHYFDQKLKLKRKVLFTSLFKAKRATGIHIRNELKKRFKKMGFDAKSLLKLTFVTDQGGNIKKALKHPYNRKNCRAHLLNTILKNTFESDDVPLIVTKTIIIIKKIVCYLKQSAKFNQLSKCVVQDCGTRWNYKHDMINSVVRVYSEIERLLSKKQRKKWSIDLELAEEMIRFLKPFKEACKSMEGDTYPTANKILLWWAELSDHLNEEIFQRSAMKRVVRIANEFFTKKYSINMTDKIACFLDPRYRSLKMLTDDDRDEVYDEIKSIIRDMRNSASSSHIPIVETSILSCFEESSDEVDSNEFELYMRTADYSKYLTEDNKHLVELFWKDNEKQFPNLYNLVRKRLNVPASSGSSERVFSDAGRIFEKRRTKLKPDRLDDLLFIRDHFADA